MNTQRVKREVGFQYHREPAVAEVVAVSGRPSSRHSLELGLSTHVTVSRAVT
jgi:hypothetical protein